MSVSDATLVLKTLEGDEAAFGELYDRYAALIRAICYDVAKNVNGAQDLGQEVFLRAYVKLNKLADPERFGPWLVGMARNVCREYRRSRLRDRHVLAGLNPAETITAQENDSNEQLLDLKEAISKLDEQERLALHVYYLQEQDAEQAQKILGISRSGLYRLLAKARKKIEKHIGNPES